MSGDALLSGNTANRERIIRCPSVAAMTWKQFWPLLTMVVVFVSTFVTKFASGRGTVTHAQAPRDLTDLQTLCLCLLVWAVLIAGMIAIYRRGYRKMQRRLKEGQQLLETDRIRSHWGQMILRFLAPSVMLVFMIVVLLWPNSMNLSQAIVLSFISSITCLSLGAQGISAQRERLCVLNTGILSHETLTSTFVLWSCVKEAIWTENENGPGLELRLRDEHQALSVAFQKISETERVELREMLAKHVELQQG